MCILFVCWGLFTYMSVTDNYPSLEYFQITGQWKGVTAGGCGNYPETHKNNPIYQIKLDNSSTDNYILIELLGPK